MTIQNTPNNSDQAYDDACQFIIKLGTAVHGYGPSAARLEFFLGRVTQALGFCGTYRSTPSQITFAFWKKGELWQRTHIATVPVGGYNMDLIVSEWSVLEAFTAFIKSEEFKEVTSFGLENILAERPRHKVYKN